MFSDRLMYVPFTPCVRGVLSSQNSMTRKFQNIDDSFTVIKNTLCLFNILKYSYESRLVL